jgi:uncharacterized OsmC-like protein
MRTDLTVRAVHLGDMRVDVQIRDQVLPIDYPSEAGRNPTSLEMLLASLASCAANTLHMVLIRKMGAKIQSLEVEATAQRREEHPTVLTKIELVYRLLGEGLDSMLVERAIRIAEDQLCPVMAMLRPGTKITSSWRIE